MLLCRRIARAHASNSASVLRLVQSHVRARTSHKYPKVSLVTRGSVPKAAVQLPPRPGDPAPDPALLERVLRVSRYSVPKTKRDFKPVAEQVLSENTKHGPFDAYAELRAQDPAFSASLPTGVLCCLADGAVKHGSQDIVDNITADVLDDHLLQQDQRAEVAMSLLCTPRRYSSLLSKQTTLSLLDIIHREERLPALPALAVLHTVRTILHGTTLDALDRSWIDLVFCSFLRHLESLESPTGAKAVSYRPPEAIPLAYMLIDKLVSVKGYNEAFQLFQTLLDHGQVPAEALLSEVPSPVAHDFSVVMRTTLARACLHWDLYHQGVGLIASIMKTQESLREDLEPVAVELLHSSLARCSGAQFKACAWLMCHLVDPRHGIIIPTQIVHLFYSQAMRWEDCEAAYLFYSHTQSGRVKTQAEYPPPQGATLTWMMAYLVEERHDAHLARCLAKQAVRTREPIRRYDRGRFIALAAIRGLATEARALWERYSVGNERELVVGSAATMLRVVSLFAQRSSWTRAGGEEANYYDFGRRVLEAFRATIFGSKEASHFDLSALARGYFMLGKTEEGFKALRILIGRREIPDRHDINVALSAMARQSPRAARDMVERMMERGLRPDGITFGTVMHEAIVQGDEELVRELRESARQVGVSLSAKTMVSLIRASVAAGETDEEVLRANVRETWEVVRAAKETSVVRTPNVGKWCIAACLRLDEAALAFEFWALLVRGRTEWCDSEQTRQRQAIAALVRRQGADGRLEWSRARAMLGALGDRGV